MINQRTRVSLDGLTVERLCAAIEWRTHRFRNWVVSCKRRQKRRAIDRILSNPKPNRYYDSNELFGVLQNQYPPRPEYGYDYYSIWRRASERASSILKIPELRRPNQRFLEVGAGDGVAGRLLADYGHDITLCDIQDWRDERASQIRFLECDICQNAPFENDSFDLIYSYNTFEHLEKPQSAFEHLKRLCRPGGFILLSFGPLYCSPWGLHAYRALRMPYPQFLFSRPIIDEKIKTLGIYDRARKTYSLQPLNQWRLTQYKNLWSKGSFEVRAEYVHEDWSYLDFVTRFPSAFWNMGLTTNDLVASSVYVLLRKVA